MLNVELRIEKEWYASGGEVSPMRAFPERHANPSRATGQENSQGCERSEQPLEHDGDA